MSELTRIVTAEITIIGQAEQMPDKEAEGKVVAEAIKKALNTDDVNVIKVQDFVMDKKEATEDEQQ